MFHCGSDGSSATYSAINIPDGFLLLDDNGNVVTSFQANSVLNLSDGTSNLLTFTANGDLDFANVTLGLSSEKAFVHFASDADKAGITGDATIGGTVTGLSGTLVLQNNAEDDLTLTQDGAFVFATPVPVASPEKQASPSLAAI